MDNEIKEKMLNFINSGIKERMVRVYDWKTKEVTYHTLGVKEGRLNGHIAWSLYFHRTENEIWEAENEYLLTSALDIIRERLEKENKLMVVRGADRDCTSSGMQADMTAGSAVTKMEFYDRKREGEDLNWKDYSFFVLDDSKIENVVPFSQIHPNKNMKIIWKFELKMEALQELDMPVDHRILSVGVIKNVGYLWAEVSGDVAKKQKIKILTVPTGTEYNPKAEFIGTLLYKDGEIVQHIFKA